MLFTDIISHTPKLKANGTKHLLPQRPAHGGATRKGETEALAIQETENDQPPRLKQPAEEASREPSSALFITSRDLTTKDRHVIFLQYNQPADKEVDWLSMKYKLGAYASATDEEGNQWYITEKTFSPERAEKIYRASHSVNKTTFLKFHRAYLPWRLTVQNGFQTPQSNPHSNGHRQHINRLNGKKEKFPTLEFSNVRYKNYTPVTSGQPSAS